MKFFAKIAELCWFFPKKQHFLQNAVFIFTKIAFLCLSEYVPFFFTALKTPIIAFVLWTMTAFCVFAQNQWAKEYFQRGEIELYLGDHKQAITQYDLALKQWVGYADAYFSRGRAYLRLQERQKAAQDFYETIRLQPNRAEAYFYLGAVFKENKEYDRALEHFNRALQLDNTLPIAYNYRAEVYRIQGLVSLALEDYNKAIQYGGKQAPLFFGRGKCWLSLRKPQEAVADFTQAIQLETRQPLYYQYRLEANFVLGEYAQTAQDIEHLIGVLGGNIEPTYKSLLVFCYLQTKNWQKAIQAMENLPTEQKNTPTFWANRGDCYLALQKNKEALADYQALLAVAPDSVAHKKKCLSIWWAGKDYSKLIDEAMLYLEARTQDAEVWYWVAFAHFALDHKKDFKIPLNTAHILGYKREDMDTRLQPYVKKGFKQR